MVPLSAGIRCISSRAVVDLPQPDSPTMPSVSPGCDREGDIVDRLHAAWRLQSALAGKCLSGPRSGRNGLGSSPRDPTGKQRGASQPHVHGLAQPVAHQVEAHRGDEDHHSRQRRD